jgi:hypothetical protein
MRRTILGFAIGVLAASALPAMAFAVHARPESASPVAFQLVPAFQPASPCAGIVSTHNPPLALPACNPPVQRSSFITLAAADRPAPYNQPADGRGSMTLQVTCLVPGSTTETGESPPCPAPGDQGDVKITFNLRGVRCVGVVGQGGCPGGAGSLYSGKLLAQWTTRITDHDNSSGLPCDPNCPGTAVDIPLQVGTQCSSGSCNYVTSLDLTIPGLIKEQKRIVLALGKAEVQDAGTDGNLAGGIACPPTCAQNGGDGAATAFVQGAFVP